MGVMTIHAIHALGHHLCMHVGRQSFFGVAFIADTILVQQQQGGVFGAMGQMAGGTVSDAYGAMNKSALNKVDMTHPAQFTWGTDQSDFCLKIMAISAFFLIERLMPGHNSLIAAQCCQLFTGHHGQIFCHFLLMIGSTVLVRRRKAGNTFENGRQNFMAGNLVASGQEKAEGKKKKGGSDKEGTATGSKA